jgi:hypothetical protein
MVYYKTNWVRDSNQWVMRKIRPAAWGIGFGALYFHFTLYEHLNRRVAFWNKWLDFRTEEEKQRTADKLRT